MAESLIRAPDFPADLVWLRPSAGLRLVDLRGRFVLLDFWTFCCINCLHVLPELTRLEERYGDVLTVVGILSPKFPEEVDPRKGHEAIERLGIRHFVALDAGMNLWRRYGVRAWPTLVLIDPAGRIRHVAAGEGHGATLARVIETLQAEATGLVRGAADYPPLGSRPLHELAYPGKITLDEDSLAISDSGHHRVLVIDRRRGALQVVGRGTPGSEDGSFSEATFRDPQGLALRGRMLYVADRGNHLLRAIDLDDARVRRVAGTGQRGWDPGMRPTAPPRPALTTALASPWDLAFVGEELWIAMAGNHQLWVYDPSQGTIACRAGSGREDLEDGSLERAAFAQPSGLCPAPGGLFVADAESSAVRHVDLGERRVRTLVGSGLFDFGDRVGPWSETRLQHPLGVAWDGARIWVADSYNGAIKILDPARRISDRLVDGLDEPGGLAWDPAAGVWIADTNHHRILRLDPARGEPEIYPIPLG